MPSPGPAFEATPGQLVGPYRLRRFHAHGGMAELYLAFRPDAKRREVVVVKRILPQYAEDEPFARMFAREVELASQMRHPNLVRVYDAGQGGPRDCYLAMEYVHGLDLARVLRELRNREQRMDVAEAVLVAQGMCAGLHHAHEQTDAEGNPLGIVHRDVSPSNVLVGYDGEVKITDFGVAKALALTSFTQAGTRKGKLSYMSPEQARAEPFDRRTDVFAIGVVLFEMTTGQRLFAGDNELAIIHNMLFRELPRPSEIVRGYPPALEAIVMKAVAPKADDRFATAQQLRRALEGFVQQRGGLPPSRAGLSNLLESLIPAPPHPATEPGFFDDDDGLLATVGRDQVTRIESGAGTETSADVPDAAERTEWSSPRGVAAPRSGPGDALPAISVSASGAPHVSAPTPVAGVPIVVPSQPTASMSVTTSITSVRSGSSHTAAYVVGGLALVAATIVAGGWFASWATREPAESTAPAEPEAASPPAPTPAPDPIPVVLEPAEPAGDDVLVIDAPPPEPMADPEPAAPPPTDDANSSAVPPKGRERRRKAGAAGTPAPAEDPAPSTATPAEPTAAPPPPPPPSTKSKKRAPTDTLLPIRDG